MPGKDLLDMTEPLPSRTSTAVDAYMRPAQECACHFIAHRKGHIRPHPFLKGYWQQTFVGEGCHFIGGIATEKLFVLRK